VTLQTALTSAERKPLAKLSSPVKIQAYLDSIPYSTEERYRCPLSVLRDQRAHCYDGAVFAAAMLQRIGYPPLIVNLFAYRDDEHLLAVFKCDGHWGAVAKSNFVGLRYREPIYRSLRELVVSYFEDYYNLEGIRSLRSYTRPFDLNAVRSLVWHTQDAAMHQIAKRLDALRRVPVLTSHMIAQLSPLDRRSYEAGMWGTNMAGVYQPD
jgi:hypothetical protein